MSQVQKHNLAKIAFVVLASILLYGFLGCDVSKKQAKHYKKFIQYGGKVNCKSDTVTYRDTTWLEGKPIIKEVKIPCDCGEPVIGYTNKQLRMILRAQKDSMNYLIKLEKIRSKKLEDSLNGILKLKQEDTKQVKEETKQVKTQEKPEKINAWANLIWIVVFVLGLIALIIYLIKRK